MVTTAIDGGNFYVTDGSVSGNNITTTTSQFVIKIDPTTKIDYNLDNALTSIPSTTPAVDRTTKEPFMRVIDLKKITESITVQGTLSEAPTGGTSDDGTVKARAIDKRDDLIKLMKQQSNLTVVWGQGNHQTIFTKIGNFFGVVINKVVFSEVSGLTGLPLAADVSGNTTAGERTMDVQIQFLRGKDIVGP